MSASTEKRNRKAVAALNLPNKEAAAAASKKKKYTIIAVVCIIIAVLLLAFAIITNSGVLIKTGTAVKVGDRTFTAADVNYYYGTQYQTFVTTYSDYISYFFDTDESLKTQYVGDDETQTWYDYFLDAAEQEIKQVSAIADQAEAAGFTITDESQQNIDDYITYYSSMASIYGYKNVSAYFKANYGKGVTEKVVRRNLELTYLATDYAASIEQGYADSYTDEEIMAYYDENADEFDTLTFMMYYVNGNDDMDDAKEKADLLTSSTSQEEFAANILQVCSETEAEYYADPNYSLKIAAGSGISANYNEWVLDSARQPGDTTAIQYTSEDDDTIGGYYCVYFIERNTNDYDTCDIRIIQTTNDMDGDGEITEDEIAAAYEQAESVEESWETEEDATEDSFSYLASILSEDDNTSDNGGLIEDVNLTTAATYGQEIVDWALFTDHTDGKLGIVQDDDNTYVIMYVPDSMSEHTYAWTLADTEMADNDYTEWQDSVLADYEIETNSFRLGLCG